MGACVVCEQQITNPLSPERLVEQMKAWLNDENQNLVGPMQDKAEEFLNDNSGDDTCVITGRRMHVCTYCFTEHIFKWLLTLMPSQELVDEYLTYFSFDVSRKGYIAYAEKLGYIY